MRAMLILAAAVLLAPASLTAQASCAKVPDSLKRLACYDSANAAGASGAPSKPAASGTSKVDGGNWTLNETTDPMTDRKRISATLVSSNKVGVDEGLLVVRCFDNELDVFINFDEYLADYNLVTMRFDSLPPETKRWSASTNKTALFATGDKVALLQRIMTSTKFAAQTIPYNEGPRTYLFEPTGGQEPLTKILDTCTKK